nr:VOC family protein [Acidobacteriota bacterium]
MNAPIEGLHHVTAMASDPQRNVDFYTHVLGLRLVKKTVNFDDPSTYHLYYGNETGTPGTIITFFPRPKARRGIHGAGQATVTGFSVPAGSLGYWSERLPRLGVSVDSRRERFSEEVLTLLDPDGLKLELVAHAEADERSAWRGGGVPLEHAIRGLGGVSLTEWSLEATAELLTGTLGFRLAAETGERWRFTVGAAGPGARLDVLAEPAAPPGRIAAGTVHH